MSNPSKPFDALGFLVEELKVARAVHAEQRQARLAGNEKEASRLWFSNARRLRNVWRLLKEQADEKD